MKSRCISLCIHGFITIPLSNIITTLFDDWTNKNCNSLLNDTFKCLQ